MHFHLRKSQDLPQWRGLRGGMPKSQLVTNKSSGGAMKKLKLTMMTSEIMEVEKSSKNPKKESYLKLDTVPKTQPLQIVKSLALEAANITLPCLGTQSILKMFQNINITGISPNKLTKILQCWEDRRDKLNLARDKQLQKGLINSFAHLTKSLRGFSLQTREDNETLLHGLEQIYNQNAKNMAFLVTKNMEEFESRLTTEKTRSQKLLFTLSEIKETINNEDKGISETLNAISAQLKTGFGVLAEGISNINPKSSKIEQKPEYMVGKIEKEIKSIKSTLELQVPKITTCCEEIKTVLNEIKKMKAKHNENEIESFEKESQRKTVRQKHKKNPIH